MGSPPVKVPGLVLAPHWEQAAPKSGLWMAGPDQLQSLSGGVVLVGGADGPGRQGFPILAPVFALLTCWVWVKAQHEGALPPPCIVRKDPRVPHTARRGA